VSRRPTVSKIKKDQAGLPELRHARHARLPTARRAEPAGARSRPGPLVAERDRPCQSHAPAEVLRDAVALADVAQRACWSALRAGELDASVADRLLEVARYGAALM